MADPGWLPQLEPMQNYGGDWARYCNAIYDLFLNDFQRQTTYFSRDPVVIGHQLIDGKLRTFWHLTSEGKIEVNRTPDLRRCERIRWVRAVIEHSTDPAIKSWPQDAGRKKTRQVLWLEECDFVVILERRSNCWWLWTAFPTNRRHTRVKLQKQYDAWVKANAAP